MAKMTNKQFVEALELAYSLPNFYCNKPGKNLGFHWADGRFSYDCWNLDKVALTGKLGTNPVGTNIPPTTTGDLTGKQLLNRCTYRSRNFSRSVLYIPGTYLYLESSPHAGVYVGEKVINGRIVNVIECTANKTWGANGVVYSYVDAAGRRFNYKGGKQSLAWSEHGLLTEWVDYAELPKPVTYDIKIFRKDVCSILAVETCADAFEKTIAISRVVNKNNVLVTPLERYFKAISYYKGVIEADNGKKPSFGGGMYEATKLYQINYVGSKGSAVDGKLSKKGYTWRKLLLDIGV